MWVGHIQSIEGHKNNNNNKKWGGKTKNQKQKFPREEGIPFEEGNIETLPEFVAFPPAHIQILESRLPLQLLPEFPASWHAWQISDLLALTIKWADKTTSLVAIRSVHRYPSYWFCFFGDPCFTREGNFPPYDLCMWHVELSVALAIAGHSLWRSAGSPGPGACGSHPQRLARSGTSAGTS